MDEFALGWMHEQEAKAKVAWEASMPPRFNASVFTDVDISDVAFTLANQVKFWFNQGPVGSCFANAVVQAIQISISYAVSQGAAYDEVELSRAYAWYFGRLLDGSIGNGSDGGTITNAVRAIQQYGLPPASMWPYKPEHNFLERKPTDAVQTAAKAISIKGLIDVDLDDADAMKKTIKSGLPPVIGIWWSYGWDTNFDANAIVQGVGRGIFGHALVVAGWATWNGVLFWHIINSHGPIYPNLTPELLKTMPTYEGAPSGKSYAFFVPDSYLKFVVAKGNAEIVSPVGIIAPNNHKALSWLNAAA